MSRPQFTNPAGEELTAAAVDKVRAMRRLYADLLNDVAEMGRQQIAQQAGYPSLPALLVDATRMSRRMANRLVVHAEQITETLTPTGHVTPARLPAVRQLVVQGVVDGEHVDAITATLHKLPDSTPPRVREIVETTLADTARVSEPRVVAQHGAILLARLDQDSPAPDDAELGVRNDLVVRRTRDGGSRFRGRLDQNATEAMLALLGPHTKPHSPGAGMPDPRSQAERNGDGLAAILHLAIASNANPDHGGEKPHVNLMVDLTQFLDGTGVATADSGSIFCPQAVLQTACDADLIRIVLDKHGAPLDVGRAHRVVTVRQRQALIARDTGCAFPGCHLPPHWTDTHHVTHVRHEARDSRVEVRDHHRCVVTAA